MRHSRSLLRRSALPTSHWSRRLTIAVFACVLAGMGCDDDGTDEAELPFFRAPDQVEVAWRLLVSDSAGVHWTDEPLLVQGTPEGESVRAVVHGDHGAIQEVEVYKQDLEDGSENAFMLTIPQPDASWRAIEVPDLLAPQRF